MLVLDGVIVIAWCSLSEENLAITSEARVIHIHIYIYIDLELGHMLHMLMDAMY